jgi:hypothetical protein
MRAAVLLTDVAALVHAKKPLDRRFSAPHDSVPGNVSACSEPSSDAHRAAVRRSEYSEPDLDVFANDR